MRALFVMSIRYFLLLSIIFFAVGALRAAASGVVLPAASGAELSVRITSENGRSVYSINGKDYSFEGFSKRIEKYFVGGLNENTQCHVVFRDDVPFGAVIDARKVMRSMPLRNIRYFVFSRDGIYMTEVQMMENYTFKDGRAE